jgi:hypothetical protein
MGPAPSAAQTPAVGEIVQREIETALAMALSGEVSRAAMLKELQRLVSVVSALGS